MQYKRSLKAKVVNHPGKARALCTLDFDSSENTKSTAVTLFHTCFSGWDYGSSTNCSAGFSVVRQAGYSKEIALDLPGWAGL